MHFIRTFVVCSVPVAGVSLGTADAIAEVYKCAGERGTPIYQDSPCPPGKELRNFQLDPPEITILPAPAFTSPSSARAEGAAPRQTNPARESNAGRTGAVRGDAAERKHIRAGMSEAEVLARLGQPDVTSGGKNRKSARWTYMPAPGDPDTITSLTFADGKVGNVERKLYRK